jgi:hypothetical protein
MKTYICQNIAKGKSIDLCQSCIDKNIGPAQHDKEWIDSLIPVDWTGREFVQCGICQGKFYRYAFKR